MKTLNKEDDDETDPRNTSVSSDKTLEPTPIADQSLSEASTLLGCTPTDSSNSRIRFLSDRQNSRSSRDDSISSRTGRRSHTGSIRETSFSEPRQRPRPSNLPLSYRVFIIFNVIYIFKKLSNEVIIQNYRHLLTINNIT